MQLSAPPAADRAATVEAFRPFPGAPTWDVRAVAGVMASLYPPPAQEGADGWRVARHRDAVAVGRILLGHGSRPAEPGPDQREWDAWVRTDREHLSASGLEILRADDVRTVVRVPLPDEPQCTATVRRIGAPSALTSRVEFPQWPGIGGTLRYFPIPGRPKRGLFEVTNHLGGICPQRVVGGGQAVALLADQYGLPLPLRVIPRPAR
ncbi:hypothetical protein ACFWXO_43285 [Kitasatospora sp. NPDC059088]|uniref:hypothetical protein n=1 Tax=Kitasatospora sp. NPDC059088 TaxID=3346722 RepID=UPI0036806CA2